MIQLGKLVTDVRQVDPVWTFSRYCNVPVEQFNGTTIKIRSVIPDTDDRTPSFCIYFKDNKLKFKCFSSGHSGDHINLVQVLHNLNFSSSCLKIVGEYNKEILENKEFKNENTLVNKYKVTDHQVRVWNVLDKDFWLPFDIGTSRLSWGLVQPLQSYTMDNTVDQMYLSGDYLYGYFTAKGELYKIYQPKNDRCKFINVKDYEVGSDHQEGNRFAVILSSWKDALTFKGFGLKLDMKVPSSENSFFSKEYIESLKKKYDKVFTLLDNDAAGLKAMFKYKELYNLDYIVLPLSKDVSDSVRDHGKYKVRNRVVPLIHKLLN